MHELVRFTRPARKHRIGKGHAMSVIRTATPHYVRATDELVARRVWIGPDDRGIELEIVAIVLPDMLLVIHVMPTAYRNRKENP